MAYGVCALAAALIVLRKSKGRVRVFWAIISVAMLFLGMNKQLDLQSDLTAIGRCISQHQEWYGDRREVQLHFIEGLLAAIAAILGIALWLMRRHLWQNGLALLGLGSVASFVAVRAISIHHVDALINLGPFDVRLIAILELAGLVLIAVNAFLLLRRKTGL